MRRLFALACFASVACSGVEDRPIPDAFLSVEDAHYVDETPPAISGGPEVVTLSSLHTQVVAGTQRERIRGALGPGSAAALLYIEADDGYWVVKADPPLAEAPEYPALDLWIGFASTMPAGPFELIARAVDREGRYGPPRNVPFTLTDIAANGVLIISLTWDTQSDLDIHVVDPQGVEIWSGNPNSFEPPAPGMPSVDPDAWRRGGSLDLHSNSDCLLDGRRREQVVWQVEPPPGRYLVRVDTFSLCDQAYANWKVRVQLRDQILAQAQGISRPGDPPSTHGRGAGVLALEVSVP